MKKIFLLVATVAFFAVQSNAQELKFGAKGGLNFSNLRGDNVDGDMRTGFHLGVFAEYMVNDQFSIQPEVLYSTQGIKGKNDVEAKMDYINVPVMFKYYVAPGFSLQAGPQVGFLVNSEFKKGKTSIKTEDVYKTFDFGLNFGLGYAFTENIFVEGRYNLGLAKTMKEMGNIKPDAKNSVFQISVGYIF